MDVSKCTVKLDHSVGSPEPATNWRQAVGFPVYGVGQPTEEGFVKITEKLNSKEKVSKEQLLGSYFSLLSDQEIQRLYKIYEDDFRAFGYKFRFRNFVYG